jgi:hypothetical protein
MAMEFMIGPMDMSTRATSSTTRDADRVSYNITTRWSITGFGSTDKDVIRTTTRPTTHWERPLRQLPASMINRVIKMARNTAKANTNTRTMSHF